MFCVFMDFCYRVNRILNRLSKLDNEISATSVTRKPPPLTPVEPFEEYDRTGILFGFHPGHYKLTMPEEGSFLYA